MPSGAGESTLLSQAVEVPAPTVGKASQLLDAALVARHVDEWGRPAHLVFTLHVRQVGGQYGN